MSTLHEKWKLGAYAGVNVDMPYGNNDVNARQSTLCIQLIYSTALPTR
jgi:hypothetical protein